MADQLDRLKAALADRYRIERELGSGGMATVYLAQDLKHERQVAVKVLRPELAAALGPERFHQEIKIAANLHHPHILPLYDSGDADGFLYYVMPYEEGQSLRDKLAHEGELPIAEAVRILRDVVDALSHAHKQGVVHRDIKPDNVMLAERHALVTDFGVAKAVSEATGAHKLTTEGVALGTPAYMSPEQAAADKHIDHRADIYAVGAVAYELLTGRPPFTGTTPQELLSAQVTQTPEPVTRYRELVPPALDQLVMKCLEKKAADRWQSAEELLPQLEALATPSGGITPTGTRPVTARDMARPAMRIAVVVAAAVFVGTVAALLLRDRGPRLDERRVVVVPFDNLTGDSTLDSHGAVAASWITAGLERTDSLSVVPWFVVQEEIAGVGAGNKVQDLAMLTGAGLVVSGSYFRQGDSVGFRADLTDARRMELLQSLQPVNALPSTPEQALGQLTERLLGALASILDTDFGDVYAGSTQTPLFDAHVELMAGSELFLERRFDDAIDHFTRAYEIDTTFQLPMISAAIAHSNLGRFSIADSLLRKVERSGVQLSRVPRLTLDWTRAWLSGDNRENLRKARALADYAQSSTWHYAEAAGCLENNYPAEAVRVLERLNPDRGRTRRWLPYWDVLTAAFHMLGDHRAELNAARNGRQRHPDEVDAVVYEVRALAALGRVEEVKDVLEAALALPPDATWGHAEPAAEAAWEFRAHGSYAAAQQAFALAIDRLRMHTPDTSRVTEHHYALGSTLYGAERWREAHELFVELAEQSPHDTRFQGYLGVLQARLGNWDAALQISDELAALDQPFGRGENTLWSSRIAALLGDRQQAVELLRSAINEGTYFGIWLHRDADFESLRDYPPFQELLRPKG